MEIGGTSEIGGMIWEGI